MHRAQMILLAFVIYMLPIMLFAVVYYSIDLITSGIYILLGMGPYILALSIPVIGYKMLWSDRYPEIAGSESMFETRKILKEGIYTYVQTRTKQYGTVWKTNLLGKNILVLSGSEAIDLLGHDGELLKNDLPKHFFTIIGKYLLFSEGQQHKDEKKVVSGILGPKTINQHVNIYTTVMERLISEWCTGEVVYPDTHFLTASVICSGVFGTIDNMEQLVKDVKSIIDSSISVPYTKRYREAHRAKERFNSLINTKIQEFKDSGEQPVTFLETLVADGLAEQQIIDICTTIVVGGTDTTASVMQMILGFLPDYPQVINQVREDPEYVKYVVDEALRRWAPAAINFKKTTQDVVFQDYVIPKGTSLWFNLNGSMAVPQVSSWPDADTFNPDRFKEYNKNDWVPFGNGWRRCPGALLATTELRLFVTTLVNQTDWVCVGNKIVDSPAMMFFSDKCPCIFKRR